MIDHFVHRWAISKLRNNMEYLGGRRAKARRFSLCLLRYTIYLCVMWGRSDRFSQLFPGCFGYMHVPTDFIWI